MSIFLPDATSIERPRPLRIAILGASGSIGSQALDVCRMHPDKLKLVALSVHSSTDALVAAAREFGVSHVAVASTEHGKDPILEELPENCALGLGDEAVANLACLEEVDCVLNALVGAAGIRAGYMALKANKILGYANKESIIVAGDILMPMAEPGRLIPVDSEHSAIFQCIAADPARKLRRIWLTCSGGPFYGMSREELAKVREADALAHPTWLMGPKITIDSATLMNKGFELLEAAQLFELAIDDICVLIHRQSRIHSMVEFADGSTIAQLGPSDMRIPIQYAFSYPERWNSPADAIDWCSEPPLSFGRADEQSFGCLALAKEAGRIGKTMPCVLNAANEIANAAFRAGECGFLDIERVVAAALEAHDPVEVESLEQLEELDQQTRVFARKKIEEVRFS